MDTRVSIGDDGLFNHELGEDLARIWIDRDLSWLEFNRRVLAEAQDQRTPLLERLKFLAIFSSNLDEFFMKRIAVLRERLTPERLELLRRIHERLKPMLKEQAGCFAQVAGLLDQQGIRLATWAELTPEQQTEATQHFNANVWPALTPLVVDPAHPFPFIANLSRSLVFVLRDPSTAEVLYARVKIPSMLRQWVQLHAGVGPKNKLFLRLSEMVRENAAKLYPGMEILSVTDFRVTRDADVPLDDDSDISMKQRVLEQVRKRRFEPVVRLEFATDADPQVREKLREHCKLLPVDVYDLEGELDYTALFELSNLPVPELRDVPWTPMTPERLDNGSGDIFEAIRAGDILVHHPYDCFSESVERFIHEASEDPDTVAIKMTVYRVGSDTPFVKWLIRAAESGKQVACSIELEARFDEERNLEWATELERAGAHVNFGVPGLKTHAKLALVVRKEGDQLRSYAHIGTGNYHVKTAKLYTDLGLLTCDPGVVLDVVRLFHRLTGRSKAHDHEHLLVAPHTMRPRFVELIRREAANKRAGLPARIVAKMNQLEDPEIIGELTEAARAGVPVELIVRGFCCLQPGVEGHTEGIRVRSIIGRFLEHSRVFHFAAGQERHEDGEFYIGSADWMHRNLSKRVEVVTPVREPSAKRRLWDILEICLQDERQSWLLEGDGNYRRIESAESKGTHATLMEMALARIESRPYARGATAASR